LEPDVWGDGWLVGSTRLSVLDFEGERGSYGEAPDEFKITGYGMVKSLGADSHDVRLEGYGTVVGGTPFVENFEGHVVVTSVENYVWPDVPDLYQVRGVVAAKVPARRARHYPPSRAYMAFKDLGRWLAVSDDELAKIIEVSRTTVSTSWKHGNEPRKRAQARRLFQLHSVVRALHQALGDDLSRWLESGNPCPLKLLELRSYERFERFADHVIFPRGDEPVRRLDAARLPDEFEESSLNSGRARPLKRSARVRSRRLGRD
jgi:hypothetical protein